MEEHPEKEPRENPKKKKITRLVIVTVLGGIFLPVIGYLADLYVTHHLDPHQPGHWVPWYTALSVMADILFIFVMCEIIASIRNKIRKDDP